MLIKEMVSLTWIIKSPFVLLALGLWALACTALSAEEDDPDALNQQITQLFAQGKYKEAIPIAERVVEAVKRARGPEQPETAEALNNLAVLYLAMGEYAKAEPLDQEALRIFQKVLGPEHPDTATSLNTSASLYQDMGKYAKAEPLFQEALRIRQKVLGAEHPRTAASLNNLGELYKAMGEYAKAEPPLQEALRIFRKVLGPQNRETATSLNNLGELYKAMGEYAKAEPLNQEALRIYRKVLGPEHPSTATNLENLAELYWAMGEYAKAEPLYQEALRICQKGLGPEHPQTARSFNNLALLYEGMGDYAEAEPLLQEALRIRQKVLGPEHPLTALSLSNLAYCQFDLGRIDEATALARQASAAQLTVLSEIFSFTSEQQRLAYLDIFDPYSLFPFLQGTEADLATAVLRYKGVVLDSIVEDRLLAEASQGSEDQKLVDQLNLDKSQLGQLLLQPAQKLTAETSQRIEALEREVEKIESELAQHVAGLGQARHALGVRLEQVQAAIPNDGALIEYLRYWHYLGKHKWEQRYGAIVLFSKGAPLWIPIGKVNEIEHLVQRYGALVRDSTEEEELSANLQALYEAVWAPISQALSAQIKKIIISPDVQLNFISFATLLTKDKQFLAQTYDVQYVASGRDLLRELKPSTAREVVLFANPDFDLGSTAMLAQAEHGSADPGSIRGSEKREIEDWSFGSLEGTQKERDELMKKFVGWGWTPTDFTKKDATKEALLKIHSAYILHLATHGFFAKEDPTETQTEPLAPLNDRQSVTKSKFFKNPMHRSGLALAGAQTTIEAWKRDEVPPVENDGILTAEDVGTLDLQGTWLVTLSACDTGSGEARAGEGVMGLRRGFIQAGAQNLLMTLWPISDEVTAQIMSDFYEAAHTSGNAPEALAKVQRDWLVKLRKEQGLASAVSLAGPFIMSFQGSLGLMPEPSVGPTSPLVAVAPSPKPSELLVAAQRDLDAKDFAKALDLFQQAADAGSATAMNNLGVLYRDGQGVAQDYGKAREWFQRAANAGDAAAMNHLGWLYDGGKDVAQDYDMARQWYQKAADAGNTDAMYNLGLLYRDGQGVAQDYDKACEWFQKAARAGDSDAMDNLGLLYRDGKGVARDYGKARDWFQKGADAGSTSAMKNLGRLYEDGKGVDKDYGKAREWFQKAVDAGDAGGMNSLGWLYEYGKGFQDYDKAREWLKKAIAAGNTDAMTNLGMLYLDGHGVVQDYGKAREWLQKAIDAGNANAMASLGWVYENGPGVAHDDLKACEWYQKAADAGDPFGMKFLGVMYEYGHGVAQDYVKARKWYQKAADAGNIDAIVNLGRLYLDGKGVPKDYGKAREWYQKAADADPNNTYAKQALLRLEKRTLH
jgi:TPR repeat protein/Tfp pilus assembly protein PilF